MKTTTQRTIGKITYTLTTDTTTGFRASMTRPSKGLFGFKYVFNFLFKDQFSMDRFILTKIEELQARVVRRTERKRTQKDACQKAKSENLETFVPGAILHGSRGYEQTNCEYAKIIERKGNKVKLIKLGHITVMETSHYSANVLPGKELEGKEFEAMITHNGVRLNDCCTLDKWDGTPNHSSRGY